MRFLPGLLTLSALAALAATPNNASGFSLLPKSFQKNPRVDFNIITEMTKEGRQVPPPTPESPVYYVEQPGAFVQLGHGASTSEKPPALERLKKALETALATNGYLPAKEGHPPTIVITYSWGSHSSVSEDNSGEADATLTNEARINDMVARARLVGGEPFAAEFIKALAEAGASRRATAQPRTDPTGTVEAQPNTMGEAGLATMTSLFQPVERLRRKSIKNTSLLEDVAGSVYFMVASAYDFGSARTNSKILLWRTKMSVNASGLDIGDTLPALVLASGPYLGKDMAEVEVLGQSLNRGTSTRLGPLEVEGYYDKDKAPKLDKAPTTSEQPAAPPK